jgi:TusA-related sulfurtransferase
MRVFTLEHTMAGRSAFKSTNLLACAALMAATAAHSTEVAPYFYTWGFGSNAYKANSLAVAKSNGVTAVTLAFGVSGGGCTLGGGLEVIMNDSGTKSDVQQFIAQGGKVILSFGGADGQYLESACSETGMYNLVKSVLTTQNIHNLDFDVEGSQLGNTALNTTRSNVIKRLQADFPDLYVSFTLPVDTTGLPGDALTLLKSANTAGVNISVVNVMTMDYGADNVGGRTMGSVAVSSAQGTQKQLKSIFTGRTDAQLWAMVGITPMIGQNDDSAEVFKPADATTITQFAEANGVGLLSYWALQRDQTGTANDLDRFSRVNTSDYQFYKTMAAAKTSTQPVNGAFPAGTYTIKSAYDGKCVDINAASTANSAQVQQFTCNGTGAQSFAVSDQGSGWYKILNANSGKAVDIASASTADGANVQQYTDNGTGAQRFSIVPTDSADPTAFSIMNQTSGKCLDIKDWSTADRGTLQQWTCSGGLNQGFRFYAPGSTTPAVSH